ncbi:zinc metalloprotease HtpX [Tumidithrix helvetica PCC 7403]|uniref:M48 family metalloprotease n=1 Tax=Tumidithrix helvetica TaxID=3457545 RepID=UPI003C896003
MSLKAGKEALLRKRYTEVIAILSEYCQGHPDRTAKDYIQAQMWMVKAYQKSGRADKAIAICEQFEDNPDPQLQQWSKKSIVTLRLLLEAMPEDRLERNYDVASVVKSSASRYRKTNVTLAGDRKATYIFVLAMFVTVLLVFGLILGAWLWGISLISLSITSGWWMVAGIGTGVMGILLFFMSPWIIEVTQKQYQRTQWITLADLDLKSPEAVEIIEKFCETKNIHVPRLGWIEDDSPVAFTYGILPNSTRIVVSRGLFLNLDDDEIATVYAQQLAHIQNWSFSVITFASAPIQILYLIYVALSRKSYQAKRAKNVFKVLAAIASFVYACSTYLLLFITKSSTYPCDRFAAEVTGNPNALSRALTKIAGGLVQQNQLGKPPNRLLESTRALGVCDYQTTTAIGIAQEILHSGQSDQNVYRVFLWELFNPWSRWIEFHSTHPLIGRRIKVLTGYTKQLGLISEYDFPQLLKEGSKLDKGKLYRNFARDLFIQTAPYTGVVVGLIAANLLYWWVYNNWLSLSFAAIGLGLGWMFQGSLRYPNFRRVVDTDLVSLLIDPYASCLHGLPVQVPGELIGYSSDENYVGYALKLEDQGGLMYVHFLPNWAGMFSSANPIIQKMETLIDQSVIASGWFRRGSMPIVDLSILQPILGEQKQERNSLTSYHQFWNNILSSAIVLLGLLILIATSPLF